MQSQGYIGDFPCARIRFCSNCRIGARPHHLTIVKGKVYSVCDTCGEKTSVDLGPGAYTKKEIRQFVQSANGCIGYK